MKKNMLVVIILVISVASYSSTDYLNFWTPFTGGDAAFMGELVREYNRTDNKYKVHIKVMEWENYYSDFNENSDFDIAIVHASKLADIKRKEILLNIDSMQEYIKIDWGEYPQNLVETVKFDNEYLAIPLDTHALIMYYNYNYLNDAGLINKDGSLKVKEGKEGLLELFSKLKEQFPNKQILVSANTNVFPFWIWYALYSQIENGGDYIVDGKAAFNNKAGKIALDTLLEFRNRGLWEGNISDAQGYNFFKFERGLVTFSGVWATGNFELNKSLNFGAVPFPKIFDKSATWGDSHTIVINKWITKERQIEAIKFVEWLTDNGLKWAKAGHIPSKNKVRESEAFRNMDYRKDYAEAINDVNFYPNSPNLWQCNDKMVEIFVKVMEGKIRANEALDIAEYEINKILGN